MTLTDVKTVIVFRISSRNSTCSDESSRDYCAFYNGSLRIVIVLKPTCLFILYFVVVTRCQTTLSLTIKLKHFIVSNILYETIIRHEQLQSLVLAVKIICFGVLERCADECHLQ